MTDHEERALTRRTQQHAAMILAVVVTAALNLVLLYGVVGVDDAPVSEPSGTPVEVAGSDGVDSSSPAPADRASTRPEPLRTMTIEQAPQSPSAQPSFVPVSPQSSRRYSRTVRVGDSESSVRGSPFRMKLIPTRRSKP